MSTTLQVSEDVRHHLAALKLFDNESFNDVILRLLEDYRELSNKTEEEIEIALREVKKGKFVRHEDLKKEFGL
jgi:predicted CopG family antitoxin